MSGLNPTRCRNKVTHPFYARWPGVRAPPETCRSWLQLAPAEIGERESRSSVSPSRALPLALAPVRPPLDNQPHSSHDTRISPPPARVLRRPPRRVVLPHTRCPHEPRALPLHNPLPLASTSRVPTPRLSLRLARPHFTRPLLDRNVLLSLFASSTGPRTYSTSPVLRFPTCYCARWAR